MCEEGKKLRGKMEQERGMAAKRERQTEKDKPEEGRSK
jgi:hypothetical protein